MVTAVGFALGTLFAFVLIAAAVYVGVLRALDVYFGEADSIFLGEE